jgi:hypothetical protein
MGIQEIIGNHREQILSLAAKYGASDVRIFGSLARGTADENSDHAARQATRTPPPWTGRCAVHARVAGRASHGCHKRYFAHGTRRRPPCPQAADGACRLRASRRGISPGSDRDQDARQLGFSGPIFQSHGFGNIKYVQAAGEAAEGSIINAGDGAHEHPTQALLDLFTIRERRPTLEGLKVAIVGDILHSRVARSNIFAMRKMGMQVRVCGPPTLLPRYVESLGVELLTVEAGEMEDPCFTEMFKELVNWMNALPQSAEKTAEEEPRYETAYPLPDDVRNFSKPVKGEEINFQTSLRLK